MSMERDITFNLELNVEKAIDNARRLETLMFRSLGLARRLGLPDDINQAIYTVQRWVMAIRMAHTAMVMLQAARMAAGDPIAWAMALVGGASAAMTMGELIVETK